MKVLSRIAAVFVLLLGCVTTIPGCDGGNPHDAVAEKMSSAMNEFASILATVKDEKSAESAATKLKPLGEKIKKIMDEGDKLPEPSEELKKKYEAQFAGVQKKIMDEMMRIGTQVPAAMPILSDAMDAIGGMN
ncbi:MAG: hypothetical protein H6815_03820 [Phycisphaeraceae bacterium]|nr:hypothetical protein [Phycisphaerales bacterium]MCB9859557.1 hypothetical protein [Phycisphaeraceae bacterium]